MKKATLVLIAIIFFSYGCPVFASPIINELMYDLDGADIDWVEVYNQDSSDVDLTALKLLVDNSTSNHSINKSSGSQILHPGEYGIIIPTSSLSSFTAKWGSSGNLFTASFSLPNDKGKVEINNGDKNVPLSSVSYNSSQGATEDGKSLQLLSGAWLAAVPTPGAENKAPASNTDSTNTTNDTNNTNTTTDPNSNSSSSTNTTSSTGTTSGSSSGSSSSSSSASKEEPKIKVKIATIGALAFTGIPFSFSGAAFGYSGEQLFYGKYFWNFSDGDSKETQGIQGTEKFSHTYFYPGDYTVSVEYYINYYSPVPDATSKVTIKVVPMNISISKVGTPADFFIEISNNTDYAIDVSKWVLASLGKSFILPRNSLILAKKKMVLSPQLTNFNFNDGKNLKLSTEANILVFDYSASLLPVMAPTEVLAPAPVRISKADSSQVSISTGDLSAAALSSAAAAETQNASYLWPGLFVILLAVGGSGAYFIRRKKVIPKTGDDFKILD